MTRPDRTNYVAHFTKGDDPIANIVSMLTSGTIKAGSLPWTKIAAVCFTECPWSSLVEHANHYSPYGIGFSKPHVFAAGGGPAFYVRPDHYEKQQWASDVHAFVTPFWPAYSGKKEKKYLKGKSIDYSHEREWRVPHDFTFDLARVEFVILDTYEDMAKFPKDLKDRIGREKFILMDMYRKVEDLWPTHIITK